MHGHLKLSHIIIYITQKYLTYKDEKEILF